MTAVAKKAQNDGKTLASCQKMDKKVNNGSMKEEFDYKKAIEELESIARKVEDPKTGIGDIDKYMKRSQELVEACRAYLRGARESLMDN